MMYVTWGTGWSGGNYRLYLKDGRYEAAPGGTWVS